MMLDGLVCISVSCRIECLGRRMHFEGKKREPVLENVLFDVSYMDVLLIRHEWRNL